MKIFSEKISESCQAHLLSFVILDVSERKEVIFIMKKCCSVLAVILLLCATIPCAFAAQRADIQPLWVYLTQITSKLDISSKGVACVSAKATAKPGEVARMTMTVSLQQEVSGSWKEVKSWGASDNSASVSLPEKTWPVSHGYSYRAVITTKAYNENNLLEQASRIVNYGYFL